MSIKVISFDAAGTLIKVGYAPGRFAVECVESLGIGVAADAGDRYNQLYFSRLAEFWSANQTRQDPPVQAFWRQLTMDWMAAVAIEPDHLEAILDEADRQMFSTERWFELYDDAIPALELAKRRGYRLAVLSNWDRSLHRLTETLGIKSYFEIVVASLEEGVEKPDPALFEVLSSRMGVPGEQVFHIGDNPVDDIEGGLGAGWHVGWVNRTLPLQSSELVPTPYGSRWKRVAPTLTQLVENLP